MQEEGSQMDDLNIHEFELSSNSKSVKSKKIGKPKSKEYLTFFKLYYAQLRKKHHKWSIQQISHIISLLWRKKKSSQTVSSNKSIKLAKPMTGRKTFIRSSKAYGVLPNEAMRRWKRFPIETKGLWDKKGNPIPAKKPLSCTTTMRFKG